MKRRSRKKPNRSGPRPVSRYQAKQNDTTMGRAMIEAMKKFVRGSEK